MQYLLLIITIFCGSIQSVFRKDYTIKSNKSGAYFFSLISSVFALLFFVVCAKFKFDFNPAMIPYSIGFSVAYATALAGNFLAIESGPLALTTLISSYSLIMPTFHGVFVYGDKLDLIGIIGLILLAISLFLINEKDDNTKFNVKWIICIIVSFIGNGFCSITQKMEQVAFDGAYKNEFMIVALVFVSIFMVIAMLVTKEKCDFKNATLPAAGCGVANGIVNMLVMVLTGMMPSVILFPSISAGGIALGFVIAVFMYKERLTKLQTVGYVLGTVSVVLLNL